MSLFTCTRPRSYTRMFSHLLTSKYATVYLAHILLVPHVNFHLLHC